MHDASSSAGTFQVHWAPAGVPAVASGPPGTTRVDEMTHADLTDDPDVPPDPTDIQDDIEEASDLPPVDAD